jgi:two-component system, NarL family, sensor histidine kinase DesK
VTDEAAVPGIIRGRRAGWRQYLFPGMWLIFLGQTANGVQRYSHGWAAYAGYAILLLFAGCYLATLRAAWTGRRSGFWAAYIAMLLLLAAEIGLAHEQASVMFIYLTAVTMGMLVRSQWLIVAAFTAAAGFGPVLIWHSGVDTGSLITIPLVAVAMWGFFGLMRSNVALAAARAEVARLAAENERTRIARDLHDLLGQSLTTITVKAGLARRLAERGAVDRAAAEIAGVEQLSRRTLAEVRSAVAGHREIGLSGELATAREALRAAGIVAELPGAVDTVDPALSGLFGWVVREGVTNVVRHSRAGHCTIALGPGWIEVVDDGPGRPGLRSGGGTGLTGLRERVAAIGGTVDAGPLNPGWRLRVDVPASTIGT